MMTSISKIDDRVLRLNKVMTQDKFCDEFALAAEIYFLKISFFYFSRRHLWGSKLGNDDCAGKKLD